MDTSIKWTAFASLDLEEIAAYIATSSPRGANKVVQRILDAVRLLAQMPERGIVSELNDPSIREIIVGNYRVIFQIRSGAVYILRIIHGARLFENAWQERPSKPR